MSRTGNPLRLLIPALVMFVLVISSQRAGAVSILDPELALTGTLGEWKLTWTDPTVAINWDGNTGRPRLTKEVTFKNLDPISIFFEQTKPAPDDVAQPEIVFHITQDKAKNETRDDWNGFTLTLKDGTPGITISHDGITPIHPSDHHFHSSRLGANLTVDKLKFLEGADKERPTGSFILLGDGLVKVEDTLTMSNFVIHEWMVEGGDNTKLRKFEFVEQPAPVPEPTTLLLWGTTLAGLGLAAHWRRRKHN